MCQLNPLKVCLPAVTNTFAAITRYTHLHSSLYLLFFRAIAAAHFNPEESDVQLWSWIFFYFFFNSNFIILNMEKKHRTVSVVYMVP